MTVTLPDTCVRGPELSDPATLSAEIGAADRAALEAYQHGVALLLSAHTLLRTQARLQELYQTRAFLLGQLRTLEQQHPAAFAAALVAYDRAAHVTPAGTETNRCEPTYHAEHSDSEPCHPAMS